MKNLSTRKASKQRDFFLSCDEETDGWMGDSFLLLSPGGLHDLFTLLLFFGRDRLRTTKLEPGMSGVRRRD
jgi:hypothetical protein